MVDEKSIIDSVKKMDATFEKVTKKTLHGKNIAKTPDDVLDNLTKDKD